MGSISLAAKLADETGASLAKASKFVDDVSPTKARKVLDDLTSSGSKTLSSGWWKAGAATGVAGGGALAWRQQDIEEAKAIADSNQSQQSAIADIMDSDLSPEAKQQLVDQLLQQQTQPTNDDGGDGGNPFDDLLPDMGGMQVTIGLIVVLALLITLGGE